MYILYILFKLPPSFFTYLITALKIYILPLSF